jgi:SAM-dependent methyltransferase
MPDASAAGPLDDPIEAQYERWVYPARVHDLAAVQLTSPLLPYQDLRSVFWLYWPGGEAIREDLAILVAGCGTLQAAAQAQVYPRATVVGIDISRACLEHTESLKRKHNLANLTLHQLRVEDAGSLGASFDFIVCHGVLDHLADPVAGLRGLGQALRPDGVIDIMVHGKYGRLGVTVLQEMFRVMGLQQDAVGVQTVRDVLASLPDTHPVQKYLRLAAQDLANDEGLVNTFLCRRDQPLSCAECLELVEAAGLVFQGWKENGVYHADTRLTAGDRLWPHLNVLQDRQLWQAIEMMDASIGFHRLYACRADRDPATYRIQFDDDDFLDYIPVARVSQVVPASRLRRQPAVIARPPLPPMPLDERQAATFNQIDGIRSVRACLVAAGLLAEAPVNSVWARHFFGSLWRAGYAMYRLPRSA